MRLWRYTSVVAIVPMRGEGFENRQLVSRRTMVRSRSTVQLFEHPELMVVDNRPESIRRFLKINQAGIV